MMILHADWSYIEQEFECGLRDRFLMPVRSFDNAKSVTPFILEAGGRRTALFVHVEHGNAKAAMLPPTIGQVFYRPYFTFEPTLHGPVHATLSDAICDLAQGESALRIDAKLPMTVAIDLARTFTVAHEELFDAGPVTLRQVSASATAAMLAAWRPSAGRAAQRLLTRSPVRDRITPYLDVPEQDRFAALDRLLSANGIDALVLTTRLNIQEVAGVPMRAKRAPLAAFYIPGGSAWVVEAGTGGSGKTFSSPRAAFADICAAGRVACEMDDIGFGLFASLGLDARETVAADILLRRWRDHNTLPDLAFYIIAARASARAMERALEFAGNAIDAGRPVTEMDAYKVYFDTLHASVMEVAPELRVGKTLTNFHSGARTIFPANAAAAPLSAEANMLKLDTGCLLFDPQGVLLGCSDIARTLALSDAGRELYALFQRGVRDTLIPACKVGARGDAIHGAGVEAIWGSASKPVDNPLFVDLPDPVAGYDRDVGHLLGKNNLAHLTFTSRTRDSLSEGMIACCEYQWPIAGHAIAYEDTCLVTSSGGLNLTSDKS
jgi:Xaa-Pro aminopeptidase